MAKRDLNGLLGERLEEARSARNLSLSALTADDDGAGRSSTAPDTPEAAAVIPVPAAAQPKAGGWTALARGALLHAGKNALARLPFAAAAPRMPRTGEPAVRLLDAHTVDGAEIGVYQLLLPGDGAQPIWPGGGEHLLVTAGRIGIGETELTVGQWHTAAEGSRDYRALDRRPAAAILVRRGVQSRSG